MESRGMCDKCNRSVEVNDDAGVIDAIFHRFSSLTYNNVRHFLPVEENGEQICEGSPSRAQYIEGHPRDTRGYGYFKEDEEAWRAAYKAAQAM